LIRWVRTHGWRIGVIAVVVTATACSATAATRASTYNESSTTTEIQLVVQHAGSAVTGTIDIAEASALNDVADVNHARITGTLSGTALKFDSNTSPSLGPIRFVGTLSQSEIAGTLWSENSTRHIQLWRMSHAMPSFATAVRALDARAQTAHTQLESAVSRLDTRLSGLTGATRALATDTSTMDSAFAQQTHDAQIARADLKKTLTKAAVQPGLPRATVCASVMRSVGAVSEVTHDAQFLAGFIHGLDGTLSNVSGLATSFAASARGLGLDVASLTSASTALSGAKTLANGVQRAHAVVAASRTHVARIVRAANLDLTNLYQQANSMITTAGCRSRLIDASPFNTTTAA
jgi:hypothetical protein